MITKQQNTEMGIIIATALLILSIVFKWEQGFIVFAVLVLLLAILLPVLFTPVSRIWFKLARFAEKIFSFLILVLVFYVVLTPVSLLRSVFTKNDSLQLRKFKKYRQSVFQQRDHTFQPADMDNQF